jgi:glycosyltransferase involved in cell wall biosynthesis
MVSEGLAEKTKDKPTIACTVTTDLSGDRRMQRICSSLALWGYAPTLIGRVLPNSTPFQLEGVVIERIVNKYLSGPKFYLEHNWNIYKALQKLKPNAVYAVDADTLLAATFYAKSHDIPLIFDAHEYFSELPELVNRPLVKGIWHWIEKVCIPQTNARFTVSEGLAEIMSADFNTHFHTIRNIAPFKAEKKINKNAPYFVYAGAVNLGRGMDLLVAIAHQLPYPVHIVGNGDVLPWLESEIEKNPSLKEKLIIRGFLHPSEMETVIANSFAGLSFVAPLGESYTQSLGNKFFDYIQARIPQICPALPAYQDVLSKYEAGIAVPYKAQAVADAMNLLVNEPNYYQSLKANTHLAAQEFCWENEAVKLKAILQQVIPV